VTTLADIREAARRTSDAERRKVVLDAVHAVSLDIAAINDALVIIRTRVPDGAWVAACLALVEANKAVKQTTEALDTLANALYGAVKGATAP